MYDKLDIEVPFLMEHVTMISTQSEDSGRQPGFVNPLEYDFPMNENFVQINGQRQVVSVSAQKWGTISSGLSGVAVGFYPEGHGFNSFPHVRIKCSPAKVLQGHNVFGPECCQEGFYQMMLLVQVAFPKIFLHLDLEAAEVRYLDSTYSAVIPDHQWTRVISAVQSLPGSKDKVNTTYTDRGYFQIGVGSSLQRQKIYSKMEEVAAEAKDAERKRDMHRYKILTDKKLQAFVFNRRRFEATTGHRKLDNLGIPRKIGEFFKFNEWFLEVHGEPLTRYLWRKAFNKIFDQFEGHTMKNVDDSHIKLKIDAAFIKIDDKGRLYKRKANAVYATYCDIKREGYRALSRQDNTKFRVNVRCLQEIGLSRAFLKSLDPNRPNENVISILDIISIDFNNQRPEYYIEPVAGFNSPARHVKSHTQPQLRAVC